MTNDSPVHRSCYGTLRGKCHRFHCYCGLFSWLARPLPTESEHLLTGHFVPLGWTSFTRIFVIQIYANIRKLPSWDICHLDICTQIFAILGNLALRDIYHPDLPTLGICHPRTSIRIFSIWIFANLGDLLPRIFAKICTQFY